MLGEGMMNIERMASAMDEAGLSQAALAAKVGVSAGAIQQLLNGKTKRTRYVREIALALNVGEDWLLGKSDEKHGDIVEQATSNIKAFAHMPLSRLYDEWPEYGQGRDLFIDFRLMGVNHFKVDTNRVWLAVSDIGMSMSPALWPSDLVVIEWEQSIDALKAQDEIWAVGVGGLPMIRRVRRLSEQSFVLSADSPEIKDMPLERGGFDVFGPVIWISRSLRPPEA